MPISKSDLGKYKSPGVYVIERYIDEFRWEYTDEEKLDSIKIEVIEQYLRKKKLELINAKREIS